MLVVAATKANGGSTAGAVHLDFSEVDDLDGISAVGRDAVTRELFITDEPLSTPTEHG